MTQNLSLVKFYGLQLGLLLLNIVVVVLLFKIIPEKKVAATIAGASFILTSGILYRVSCRQGDRPLTPWITGGFLVLVAIPMVAVRLLNWSTEFSELSIWGIPGNEFHQLSSRLFLLQPLAIVTDGVRAWMKNRRISKV